MRVPLDALLGALGGGGILMPQDKDFKRLVRRRMSETGERYTAARAAVSEASLPKQTLRYGRALVRALEGPGGKGTRAEQAQARLEALDPELRRAVALEGLGHSDWRVRRRCAQVLDDLALTTESKRALTKALRDPHPRVRGAAFHSITCEHCKPEACDTDVRALVLLMLSDPSAEIRRGILLSLWAPRWRWDRDEELISTIRRLAEADPSARVRDAAREFLDGYTRMQGMRERWDSLSPELQSRVSKHAGKWVAIVGGRVISANRHAGQIRRDVKGHGHPEAVVCYVPDQALSSG